MSASVAFVPAYGRCSAVEDGHAWRCQLVEDHVGDPHILIWSDKLSGRPATIYVRRWSDGGVASDSTQGVLGSLVVPVPPWAIGCPYTEQG